MQIKDDDRHRIQKSSPRIRNFACPAFSSFRYLTKHFPEASDAIPRIFSLARMAGCGVYVREPIASVGAIADDTRELKSFGGDCARQIYRFSFWKQSYVKGMCEGDLNPENLVGYAIIKKDSGSNFQGGFTNEWYVFEGVFKSSLNINVSECTPMESVYRVAIGSRVFEIAGVLYCQQNAINKCCAHVALRSLISRLLPGRDIWYGTINSIVRTIHPRGRFLPGGGLSFQDIRFVLNTFGLAFQEWAPSQNDTGSDCQTMLYSGVESGAGSLLVFKCGDPVKGSGHIVPVFGHVFNRNTWVPSAELSYFMMGSGVGYMPSSLWTSDFLAHDDNFGCDFCIPPKHIASDRLLWSVSLSKPGVRLTSKTAEGAAVYLLSLWAKVLNKGNIWNKQIIPLFPVKPNPNIEPRFVMRSLTMTGDEYVNELRSSVDGRGARELKATLDFLGSIVVSKNVMVVEISLPQLFPANMRKLGEFVFDASYSGGKDVKAFVRKALIVGRLPGEYLLPEVEKGGFRYVRIKSEMKDHTRLF